MIKHYLFDLDGTLVDSMDSWAASVIHVIDDEGIPHPDNLLRTITPLGFRGSARYYIELGAKRTEDELVADMLKYAITAYETTVEAKPFVKDFIKKLNADGIPCSVLTASPHEMTDAALKRNGLFDLFDNVWSVNDFDMTKDQTEIYVEAAKRLGCDVSEILFFDDNIIALRTAKAAGCTVVGVEDKASADVKDEIVKLVDKYVKAFDEMM